MAEEIFNILVLDDEQQFTEELMDFFRTSDFDCFQANTVEEGRDILAGHHIDLLLLDLRLPGMDGLDVLKEVKHLYPEIEVIMVSGHIDMDMVNRSMRLGAFDYLRKPFRYIDLQIAIDRVRNHIGLKRQVTLIGERNLTIYKYIEENIDRQFIGISAPILKVYNAILEASKDSDANVLLSGEWGTGRKNIARMIHAYSSRKENIFCAINKNTIPESHLEREFFGYKKDAFPEAVSDKMGYLELCNQGTLFFYEIAELPVSFQEKLIRAMEMKSITRVGDTKQVLTSFRIISATSHDPEKLLAEKKILPGLLLWLNTIKIYLPALRERKEDIKPLLIHFIEGYMKEFNKPGLTISDEVFEILREYSFPCNIRELRNLSERAVIHCQGNEIRIDDFGFQPGKPVPGKNPCGSEEELKVTSIRT